MATVDTCVDGSEAVQACSKALESGRPYDLICLDLMMPKMSGLEALRLIRREEERHGRIRPHATKVIVTTAADDADSVQGAFHGLCDAYIVKPIVAEELLDVVHCLDPIAS